jgi:hypothetical protein
MAGISLLHSVGSQHAHSINDVLGHFFKRLGHEFLGKNYLKKGYFLKKKGGWQGAFSKGLTVFIYLNAQGLVAFDCQAPHRIAWRSGQARARRGLAQGSVLSLSRDQSKAT